jgi:hypothetical protein
MKALGFRIFGLKVQGWLGVQGLGSGIQGSGFRVQGWGFRVQRAVSPAASAARLRLRATGSTCAPEFEVSGSGFWL